MDFPDKKTTAPRERFIRYYKDLHKMNDHTISDQSFLQGGGYRFSELGGAMLDDFQKHSHLTDLDLLIPAYWSHEFDPNYSNCGPYLKDMYQLTCDMFDVYEQGTLAPFVALHVMKKYLASNQYSKALLLGLQQTTLPRNVLDYDVVPVKNGASGLILQALQADSMQIKNQNRLELIECSVLGAARSYLKGESILNRVIAEISNLIPANEHVCIATSKGSHFWKMMNFCLNLDSSKGSRLVNDCFDLSRIRFEHFPSDPSMLNIFRYLNRKLSLISLSSEDLPAYLVVVDEDVESLNTAVLLLRMVPHYL